MGKTSIRMISRNTSWGPDGGAANAVVKAELLEKGVRVVADHRGSSYKATIRKVGEGDGGRTTEDGRFLVHYDGQKHSSTHWITLSQIRGLLCEEDDS